MECKNKYTSSLEMLVTFKIYSIKFMILLKFWVQGLVAQQFDNPISQITLEVFYKL